MDLMFFFVKISRVVKFNCKWGAPLVKYFSGRFPSAAILTTTSSVKMTVTTIHDTLATSLIVSPLRVPSCST